MPLPPPQAATSNKTAGKASDSRQRPPRALPVREKGEGRDWEECPVQPDALMALTPSLLQLIDDSNVKLMVRSFLSLVAGNPVLEEPLLDVCLQVCVVTVRPR